jgi:hypothetical protein
LLARGDVEMGCPSIDAMVEAIDFLAVLVERVNEPGFEVGDVEMAAARIERDVAEGGSAVLATVESDVGEEFRGVAAARVQPPHGARPAVGAPHARHPGRTVVGSVQTEGGRRREVDIWLLAVVEGDAEDLPHVGGARRVSAGRGPYAPVRRAAWRANVDDFADDAAGVDDWIARAVADGP